MSEAYVKVTLKKSILDPQGGAVEKALRQMGHPVEAVRVGKYLEVTLTDGLSRAEQEAALEEICGKVLSNPVIEEYAFSLEERL
ncbi:MAG: phosphoribosylformylglycinamidine synthase subunit PurS [Gracilibacteraceae bacterium]|jgi:phosphoribosylformylglycinamidine synthase|nr:phosphoribosylformylglycinamidine synthase subunit PurS [Gracilibacteraceae bacterium]